MPPRRFSRYMFCEGYHDPDTGALVLEDPEPFPYRERNDNRTHPIQEGDTLQSLAVSYFASFPRAEGLWWIIADYQPDPIIDPTLRLEPGGTIIIPSARVVTEEIFNEARRRAAEG